MDNFNDAMKIMEEYFGNKKDNLIALATIAKEANENGLACPAVRTIDAYYEDGVFYAVTYDTSSKMKQIAVNPEVSVATQPLMFTSEAKAENLGWVLEPKNAEIRAKLREVFAGWYSMANNEEDKSCCFLAIRLTKGVLNVNHWEKLYFIDFENKVLQNGK